MDLSLPGDSADRNIQTIFLLNSLFIFWWSCSIITQNVEFANEATNYGNNQENLISIKSIYIQESHHLI